MKKLVTLDVTNTVIRVIGGVGQQYSSIAAIYGVKANPNKLSKAFKSVWREQNLRYPNFGVANEISSHDWWSAVVKDCFTRCGYDDPERLSKISTHLYLHFATESGWEVMPETKSVLQTIKSKGIKVGVISNFDERLEKVLASLGLLEHFDFVLCSQLVGYAKPDFKIYEKAIEISKLCASEALHVGDDLENDYFGPRKIGMSSVLLCTDKDKVSGEVDKSNIISNLSEILDFI